MCKIWGKGVYLYNKTKKLKLWEQEALTELLSSTNKMTQ